VLVVRPVVELVEVEVLTGIAMVLVVVDAMADVFEMVVVTVEVIVVVTVVVVVVPNVRVVFPELPAWE